MAEAETLPEWDQQKARRPVRARLNALNDRRSPIVVETHQLRELIAADLKTVTALQQSVSTVERAGGDASRLREHVDEINERLGPNTQRRDDLEVEWDLLNECCKWADMADEGLHWLGFAESRLRMFDEDRAKATSV